MNLQDIANEITELEFDGDNSDFRLHHQDLIHWYSLNEKEYGEIEGKINEFSIKRDNYQVYAWCDVSGFDYWMVNQEEPNYIQITVQFNKYEVDDIDLEKLQEDIDEAYCIFEAFESYNPDWI